MTRDKFVKIDPDGDALSICQPSNHHLAAILRAVNDRKILFGHEMNFVLDVRVLADATLE